MELLRREKMLAISGLLVLLVLIIFLRSFRDQIGRPLTTRTVNNYDHMQQGSTVGYRNGLNKPGDDFYIRQHGQYWVLYNYIKAAKQFTGNESVTLVITIRKWSNIKNLEKTFLRWHGPISLTIFTDGKDFELILKSFAFIMKCTTAKVIFVDFVSVHFIMHRDNLPKHIAWKDLGNIFSKFHCSAANEMLMTEDPKKRQITVPNNLLQNVGRLTARTHFVLLLDADIIPGFDIPELFLEMIKATRNSDHPKKAIYVLPYLDLEYDSYVTQSKFGMKNVYLESLKKYLNSTSLHKIPRLRERLEPDMKSVTEIFDHTRHWGRRLAYYISANNIEPFYDESCNSEPEIARIDHLNLLEALDYNFFIIHWGFVVHKRKNKFYTGFSELNYRECPTNIQSLKDFYKNFI